MNQPVDYDDMFPKEPKKPSIPDPEAEKEKEWQERWKKDMAERNRHSKALEDFRNSPKHHEGYFERADGLADMYFPDGAPSYHSAFGHSARSRYYDYVTVDLIFEYIDGILVAILLGVLTWCIVPNYIPITIAAAIGFFLGVMLKLKVRERMPTKQALFHALPAVIIDVVAAAVIIITFR